MDFKPAVYIVRVISNDISRGILEVVVDNPGISVGEIEIRKRLPQTVVSQHLKKLRALELVEAKREGKFVLYTANKTRVNKVYRLIKKLADCYGQSN